VLTSITLTSSYRNEPAIGSGDEGGSDSDGYGSMQDTTPTVTPTKAATPTSDHIRSSQVSHSISSSPLFYVGSSQAVNPSYSDTATPTRVSSSTAAVESSPAADVLRQMVTKKEARRYAISPRADTVLRDHIQALRDWLELRLPTINDICKARDDSLADILTAHLSMGDAGAADALLKARKADFDALTRLWPIVCDIKDNLDTAVTRVYTGLNPSYSAVFNATLVPPGSIMDTTDVIELCVSHFASVFCFKR